MIDLITNKGTVSEIGTRMDVLTKYRLPVDRQAENVVITGCMSIFLYPHVFRSLANVLEKCGSSFSFLAKEYCCGNYLFRSAVKTGEKKAPNHQYFDYSRPYKFIGINIAQARNLGSKRLVLYCSPCYPIYKYLYPQENIVFYPEILAECFTELRVDTEIDYYPGCYKLHRRLSPVPMDLESTERVFTKIKGLRVRRIEAKECCFKQAGINHLVNNSCAKTQVHVCLGCYSQAKKNVAEDVDVLMLPELLERLIAK